jgi:hypothetical protein
MGDFILQPESWVSDKNKRKIRSPKLFMHTGIHAILLALVLELNPLYWKGFVLIVVSHLIIDLAKAGMIGKMSDITSFFLDQSLHLLIILIAVSFYEPFAINISGLLSGTSLLLATAIVFVTFATAVIIKIIIAPWNPEKAAGTDNSLSRAGRFIGILERLFVFIFVVSGTWQAIGFLLAAKSTASLPNTFSSAHF